jgi:hypothetical protein
LRQISYSPVSAYIFFTEPDAAIRFPLCSRFQPALDNAGFHRRSSSSINEQDSRADDRARVESPAREDRSPRFETSRLPTSARARAPIAPFNVAGDLGKA